MPTDKEWMTLSMAFKETFSKFHEWETELIEFEAKVCILLTFDFNNAEMKTLLDKSTPKTTLAEQNER